MRQDPPWIGASVRRVAAIYDIHGNLPALEAVLEEIEETATDCIVVGGDVVPGPMPRETVAALSGQRIPTRFIRGNGEREVLARMGGGNDDGNEDPLPEPVREVLRWVAKELSPEQAKLLARWPPSLRFEIPGLGEVLFCHATPHSDAELFTRQTPEDRLLPIFQSTGADVVICGHTHMPFDRSIGGVRVVNAGSVGMPFGEPGAHWLLLGPGIEPRHTLYDLAAAARQIRKTGYPQAREFAIDNVLRPPSEAEMIDRFENAAVGEDT